MYSLLGIHSLREEFNRLSWRNYQDARMMTASLFGLSSKENLDAGCLSLPQKLVAGVGTRSVTPTEAATDKDYLLNEWTVPNILMR